MAAISSGSDHGLFDEMTSEIAEVSNHASGIACNEKDAGWFSARRGRQTAGCTPSASEDCGSCLIASFDALSSRGLVFLVGYLAIASKDMIAVAIEVAVLPEYSLEACPGAVNADLRRRQRTAHDLGGLSCSQPLKIVKNDRSPIISR